MRIKFLQNPSQTQLEQIAQLHRKVLSQSLLSKFGIRFLVLVYQNITRNSNYTTFILTNKNEICGYLLITKNSKDFFKHALKNNFFKLLPEVIKTGLTSISIFPMILKWWLTSNHKSQFIELLFLAIDPKVQRQGWGTKMIKKMESILKDNGIKKYIVRTKSNNKLSNNFYKKLEFEKIIKIDALGESVNYYIKKISD